MFDLQGLKMEEWFACYNSLNNRKIICKGGFSTALGADKFLKINNLDNVNSTLLSTLKILPDFIKDIYIRKSYTNIFLKDIIIIK